MPKVRSKRRITLPVDPCQQVAIERGDPYQRFVLDGRITMIKKMHGAGKGILNFDLAAQAISGTAKP